MSRTNRRTLFLVVMAASVIVSAALAAPDLQVFVNGKAVASEVPPVVIDGVTYLPLRATAEALGAKLEWVEKSKTAVLCSGDLCYPVRITDPASGARVSGGRILLPLRKMAEALGCDIKWDPESQRVDIRTK
jgi:hypothetical protein